MSITGSIVIFVIIWWIVFFSLLPIDVNRNKKTQIEGEDPGSPENPKIIKKFIDLFQYFIMYSKGKFNYPHSNT